jgi:cysteine-rich repeat protein
VHEDCLPPPPPTCGDGNVDTGEQCDDANEISCDGCTGCVTDKCGDNLLCGNEQCEGVNLNSQTCAGLGFDSGDLACYSNCTFNTSSCESVELASCTLKRAYWTNANLTEYSSMQEVANNTLVFLMQELKGDCTNKHVDFKMYKDGGFYKSAGVIKVNNITNTAFSSWLTNNHGNESEFYFTVELEANFNTSNKIVIPISVNDSEEGPGANCTSYGFKCCAPSLCYQQIPSLTCPGSQKCCYGCSESFEGCGDGFIQEGEEECDGLNLGGADCVSINPGYIGGVLLCYDNCTFNEENCLIEGIDTDDTYDQDRPGDTYSQVDCNGDCEEEKTSSTLLIVIILIVLLVVVSFLIVFYLFKHKSLKNLQQTTFPRRQPPTGPMRRAPVRRPWASPQRPGPRRPQPRRPLRRR